MRLAVTGGTGFVGSHFLERAVAAGHDVQALARRAQPPTPGITWIDGALDRPEALARLVANCDAVVHVAGVINGSAAEFEAGNVRGTQAVIDAMASAGVRRLVHISSLAAREPGLSAYGASKRGAEDRVVGSQLAWTVLRPPAIYGPRDRELLELFRLARGGVVPVPAGVRLSLIAVEDLVDLMLACLGEEASIGGIYDPDDGRARGWRGTELAREVGVAIGRKIVPLPVPKPVLMAGAAIDRLVRGPRAKLTRDRVRYFCHRDWTAHELPPPALWRPAIATEAGLAATAAWYRAEGWL